MADLALYSNKI